MRLRAIVVFLLISTLIALPVLSADPADRKHLGEWGAPFWEGGSEPFDPPSFETSAKFPTAATSVVLPDGRILFWNAVEGSEKTETFFLGEAVGIAENSRARILDLRSGTPVYSVPKSERGITDDAQPALDDMFCSDQKILYDGTVLVTGGTEWRDGDLWGDPDSKIFDPKTDTFSPTGGMAKGRWYPTMVTLPDGKVAAFGGVEQLANSIRPEPAFSQVQEVEVYDPVARTWSFGQTSPFSLPLYIRAHLMPNGKIFFNGVGQTWGPFGETGDEATWGLQRFYDPATNKWQILNQSAKYGVRGGAFSALLRLEPPYDTARVLIAGGTLGPSPSTFVATTISEVVTIDGDTISNEPGLPKSPAAGLLGDSTQLRNRRWFSSGVLLPTGEVIALSGGDMDEVVDPGSEAAVRMAEIYDPADNTWRNLLPASRDRTYHNSAVLLADGRILVGGHSPIPAHYMRHDTEPQRANNFKDSSFEIYSPPYLFRGPRPEVVRAGRGNSGDRIEITLGGNSKTSDDLEVVLVRLPATTHVIDSDQRAVVLDLDPAAAASRVVFAQLPGGGDGRILPPGPYYLFVLKDTGEGPVPSVAKVINILPAGGTTVEVAPS